ncbi:MAG TPA: hypothetical protein EYO51_07485 [Methylococcaceae bacterium]|nr:hypothetical protein [Methylococcaceae bacterium]
MIISCTKIDRRRRYKHLVGALRRQEHADISSQTSLAADLIVPTNRKKKSYNPENKWQTTN